MSSDTSNMPEITVACVDLDAAMDYYVDELDFRLDMIMPADAPRVAQLSGYGISLRLECVDNSAERAAAPSAMPETILVQRAAGARAWGDGRAGMQYRDLVPGRLGGQRFVRHVAADANWQRADDRWFEYRDTGVCEATAGLADVRVVRVAAGRENFAGNMSPQNSAVVHFVFVLRGQLLLHVSDDQRQLLTADDACVVRAGSTFALEANAPCEWLQVSVPLGDW